MNMSKLVFWVVTPCRLVCVYLLQGWRWRQYASPRYWYLPTSPHGVKTQKTNIGNETICFIVTDFQAMFLCFLTCIHLLQSMRTRYDWSQHNWPQITWPHNSKWHFLSIWAFGIMRGSCCDKYLSLLITWTYRYLLICSSFKNAVSSLAYSIQL
jgi:hypothetical protein